MAMKGTGFTLSFARAFCSHMCLQVLICSIWINIGENIKIPLFKLCIINIVHIKNTRTLKSTFIHFTDTLKDEKMSLNEKL